MDAALVSEILAGLALLYALAAFGLKLRAFYRLRRPMEAAPKGSTGAGVRYALTLGMMPWAKESTRIHLVAYLRGVAFHLGIFAGLGVFLISPWASWLPGWVQVALAAAAFAGVGLGLAGIVMRLVEPGLRALSTPDDYLSVLVVSAFLLFTGLWLLGGVGAAGYYLSAAVMLVYAPLGKIRHCLYYALSRNFYGRFMGARGVLPHSQQAGGVQ